MPDRADPPAAAAWYSPEVCVGGVVLRFDSRTQAADRPYAPSRDNGLRRAKSRKSWRARHRRSARCPEYRECLFFWLDSMRKNKPGPALGATVARFDPPGRKFHRP